MSRSNPYKLKPQRPRITILAVGEGTNDGAFLEYLKSLYVSRGCGLSVTVSNTYGGGPSAIISEALKIQSRASYDRSLLLLDMDVPWPQAEVTLAKSRNLILFGSQPCLEGLVLDILDKSKKWRNCTSKECKTVLKANYIDTTKSVRPDSFGKILPQETIEAARNRIAELNEIIKIISVE